jgi:hypothetical protein
MDLCQQWELTRVAGSQRLVVVGEFEKQVALLAQVLTTFAKRQASVQFPGKSRWANCSRVHFGSMSLAKDFVRQLDGESKR